MQYTGHNFRYIIIFDSTVWLFLFWKLAQPLVFYYSFANTLKIESHFQILVTIFFLLANFDLSYDILRIKYCYPIYKIKEFADFQGSRQSVGFPFGQENPCNRLHLTYASGKHLL